MPNYEVSLQPEKNISLLIAYLNTQTQSLVLQEGKPYSLPSDADGAAITFTLDFQLVCRLCANKKWHLEEIRSENYIDKGAQGAVYRSCTYDIDEDGQLFSLAKQRAVKISTFSTTAATFSPKELEEIKSYKTREQDFSNRVRPGAKSPILLMRSAQEVYVYTIMRLIIGTPLNKMLDNSNPDIPFRLRLSMCCEMIAACAKIHAAGVVHLDLKPANVIVTLTGEIEPVDFGLSETPGSPIGHKRGTPRFMSVEQCGGTTNVTQQTDIYALGRILGTLLLAPTLLGPLDPDGIHNHMYFYRFHDLFTNYIPTYLAAISPENRERIRGLLARTAEPDPANRPTLRELAEAFSQVLAEALEVELVQYKPFPD